MSVTEKAIKLLVLKKVKGLVCEKCQQKLDLIIDQLLLEITTMAA